MELIKRYQNRKLYSTTLSEYVSMHYLIDLVRTNQKFQVIDNATKQDITTNTLHSALNMLKFNRETLVDLIKVTK